MVAVAVVVLVGATTNFQKETKFRELNAVKDDIQVSGGGALGHIEVTVYQV